MSDSNVVETPASARPLTAHRAPWIVAAAAVAVALVALVALVVGGSDRRSTGGAGTAALEERGSSTPEGAVKLFAESFASGDLDAAASTFATTSMVEGYSFTAALERAGAIQPNSWLPAEGYEGVDVLRRAGDVGFALTSLTRSALMPEQDANSVYAIRDGGDLSAEDFASGLDPAGFAAISVKEVKVFEFADGTKAAQNQADSSAPWGADSSRTAVVLFDTADGAKALGLQVIQYGGSWYIWDLYGGIVATDVRALTPITAEEYDDMVSDIETRFGDS